MSDIPRLNGAIRALEQGKPTFVTFSPPDPGSAQAIAAATYDAVVFEMEHNPYEIRVLRDCMQQSVARCDHPMRDARKSVLPTACRSVFAHV